MEDKIFHFNDRPALAIQSNEVCAQLYDDFYNVLAEEVSNNVDDDLLDSLQTRVENLFETVWVTWMARYGCAIAVGDIDVQTYSITVVGLDGWKTKVHASVHKGRELTAMPDVTNPAILDVGSVPIRENLVQDLMNLLKQKLKESEKERTRQKNHKTPTFVWARLLDAMAEMEVISTDEVETMEDCYQGGTTDVGLHTGCLARNTSFPLVASVYSAMLFLDGDHDHSEFHKALCIYYLHHLRYDS